MYSDIIEGNKFMFIKTNKSRNKNQNKEYISQLLVENYWEDGQSKTRTILNL